MDEIGLFVAEGRKDDKESDVFEDSQLLGFVFADGRCLVDGAVVSADVQVRGLVLLDEKKPRSKPKFKSKNYLVVKLSLQGSVQCVRILFGPFEMFMDVSEVFLFCFRGV